MTSSTVISACMHANKVHAQYHTNSGPHSILNSELDSIDIGNEIGREYLPLLLAKYFTIVIFAIKVQYMAVVQLQISSC